MDTNFISNVTTSYTSTYGKSVNKSNDSDSTDTSATTKSGSFSSEAAVYEKSTSSDSVYSTSKSSATDRSAIVKQLQADLEKQTQNLYNIVLKTIQGQGNTFAIASQDDMWSLLASGNFTADADTIAQAQADIADDGYWGVDQTSSRIVDFAIALSGGDTDKADDMISAFKKGYEEATGTWGKSLPDISSKTYDAVMEKFQAWKDGSYESASDSE